MSRDADVRTSGPVVLLAGLVVIIAVTNTVVGNLAEDALLICSAFALFIAVGEVMRLTLPGGRQSAPLASAGALAFALLPQWSGQVNDGGVPTWLAVTVVTVGSILGSVPRAFARRSVLVEELARRVILTLVASVIFHVLIQYLWDSGSVVIRRDDMGTPTVIPDPKWAAAIMALSALVASTLDALLAAGLRSASDRVPFRTAVVDEVRALIGIASAIAATGVLIALSYPRMGLWSLPIFAVPLLLTQFSFRRYATIQATYLQTIRSLSKVTEVGGYTETGHSRRVSRLAVTVGREMGMSQRDLDGLEYAALMHDIGQLSLSDPIPGGATTMVSPLDQRQIAELGGGIIRQAGVLDKVADIVERQSDPYRPHRGQLDAELPLESRIIKAVNAYDDLVGASMESDRKMQALERLSLGTDREFDPAVVDTLADIIERESTFAFPGH
jgi:HD-GYP domain-containing protein (c-di-GMP phosphodiesterase class II)